MAVFAYKAIEAATGKRKTGELAADSAYQVRLSLRRMGLQAQTVKAVKARSGDREGGSLEAIQQRFQRSRRRQPLIEFYENLMTLIASGSAVVPSLETLAVSARKARSTAAMGTMCRQLAEQVRGGANLADAMSKQTDWFSLIDVALVRSGQQSGHLEQSLSDLASLHGQSDTLRHRLVGVMTYPVILMTVGIAVVIFLSAVPIPQLAGGPARLRPDPALPDQGGAGDRHRLSLLLVGADPPHPRSAGRVLRRFPVTGGGSVPLALAHPGDAHRQGAALLVLRDSGTTALGRHLLDRGGATRHADHQQQRASRGV